MRHSCRTSFDENGNAALFGLLLIPVLLLCGIFAVDLSNYRYFESSLERDANAIALQAAFQLPDVERAKEVVQRLRPNLSSEERASKTSYGEVVDYRIDEETSTVSVTLRASFESGFGKYFPALKVWSFGAEKTASAGLQPADVVLVVADGSTLRPGLEPGPVPGSFRLHEVFRNKDDANHGYIDWPEAEYLSFCRKPGSRYKAQFTGAKFEQWATQACFNPVYSPLKIAAISLVDALSAYGANRLAALFTPGPAQNVSVVRPLLGPPGRLGQNGGFFDRTISASEATWGRTLDPEAIITDEDCVLFSDEGASGPGPLPNFFLGAAPPPFGRPPQETVRPVLFPQCGLSFESRKPVQLDWRFLERSLLLREAIYWHAAQPPDLSTSPPQHRVPDVLSAVKRAVSELRNTPSLESEETERARRGALYLRPRRSIIVLTDALESVPEDQRPLLASALKELGAEVTIVLWEHCQVPDHIRERSTRAAEIWSALGGDNLDPASGRPRIIRFSAAHDDVTAAAYQLIETVSKPLASSLKVAVLRQ